MSKEKRRVPKLRFPGFTEDWEQRKLDDIAKIKTGGGTPKTTNLEYWSGDIPWIQSSDLVEGDVVHVNIKKFINNNALKNSAAKLISRDSIALVTRVGVGKVAVINQDFTTSQDFLSLSGFDGNDIKFIAYQLFRLMQENAKVLQGTSIKGITKTDLIEQSIAIPNSIKEQSLIANILSQTDSIITLHQRKLNNLKFKKKALLQKLFPKNGERYPELRFPGFTDAWEQRKADYIFKSVTEKGYPELPVLSASQELGMVYRDQNGIDIQHDKKNESSYKRVSPGQFVIHLRSFQGGFAYSEVEGITSPAYTVMSFKNSSEQYGLFWKYVFKSETFIKRLETITYGIRDGRSISFSDFKSLMLQYPSFLEQELIGDLIAIIESGITLHQRKLEHLQLQKKALLQQMFV